MAVYEFVIHYDKCCGCRICEGVCAIKNTLAANPQKSMIRVVTLKQEISAASIPVKCMQCERPVCEAVCPVGAISTHAGNGARIVDAEKCIGCSACVYACPFGAATLDRKTGTTAICGLCDGDPLCVRFCPFGALEYILSDEVGIHLRRVRSNKLSDLFNRS